MSPDYSRDEAAGAKDFQRFLDGAIHGLRGPLRGIGTSAGLLSQKWNDCFDAEARGFIRSILDGVSTLANLTKALSDYSVALAPQCYVTFPIPVENAVRSAMAALRQKIEQTGANIYVGPLPGIPADHEQLSLLFHCLLKNALENEGGESPRIEITATRAAGEWRFAVSDNGVGISAQFHRKIFEPFERLHSYKENFGLGLTIAAKIVGLHGGRLWVVSQEGEGSTFFFTLPAGITT